MNYIKHLTGFFEKVSIDFELNPTHISLYMAIFQLWNQNRFQNPIGISRDELMRISKISSTATYHKCIKELAERKYVNYKPSYNPFKGSTLEVINLDFYTKPIPKKEIKKMKILQKNEQVVEQALNKHQTSTEHLPYINNTNSLNIVNGQAIKNDDENSFLEKNNGMLDNTTITQKKWREKKDPKTAVIPSAVEGQIPPDWENVLQFFKEKNATEIDAQKFYNHFQSNGWLVGGKSKMKDWKAAARNWMLNSQKFSPTAKNPQPNHLHTSTQKNYGEPL